MDVDALTQEIIGAAIEVHRHLGPGLLESAYGRCLERELGFRGLRYEKEVPVALDYKGVLVQEAYRIDLLVENRVVVELKVVEQLTDRHKAQLLTYLRLTRHPVGLLINFNETRLKHGIRRLVYHY